MEIKQYLGPLLKWWKLILLACVLAGITSFLVVMRQPPSYQTRSTLVIGRAVYEPNPTSGELGIATQLASYYADIVQREVVRAATMEALNLKWLPGYTAVAVPNSALIEIMVTDTDPARAQAVANELANQLIKQSPSNVQLDEQRHQEFINRQLDLLETQITSTLDEMAKLEEELGGLTSARKISDTQSEIAALEQKLRSLQTNYATLLGNATGRAMNSLTIIEPAALPVRPVGPNRAATVLMSIAIAFFISAGAAYLLEYLDDTLKSPEEITRAFNLPVIGYIAEMGNNAENSFPVVKNPKSAVAEAFRSLRMNLEFVDVDNPSKALLIASVSQKEGKSVVATNLALTMAQASQRVILLDADFRKPSIHTYMGLENEKGFSDLFRGNLEVEDVLLPSDQDCLRIITSGAATPNPSDLVGSKKMDVILSELRERADILVLDGPPALITDAKVLATKVDAVVLVVGYGITRRSEAQIAIKQLNQAGANIAGVVMNRIPLNNKSLLKLYHYYYGVEETEESKPPSRLEKLRFPKLNVSLRNPLKAKSSAPRVDD